MKRLFITAFGLFVLIFAFPASSANVETCLACHGDKNFSIDRKGKSISLYVDGGVFNKSIHAAVECTGCHVDADVKEMPHPEVLKAVDCVTCHKDDVDRFNSSIHGEALKKGALYAPKCSDCHGKHDILGHRNPSSPTFKMNIPSLCGKCHRDEAPATKIYNISEKNILENYKESIHGEGLLKKGLLVTAACNDCHTSHSILPHTDVRASTSVQNIAQTCSKCHVMIEQVHKKVIKNELWEKKPGVVPACTDCHSPHEVRREPLVIGMADRDCIKCHEAGAPFVHQTEILDSAHNKIPCVKCHSDVSPEHERPCDTAGMVNCTSCHAKQGEDYTRSIHGQFHSRGDPDVPWCTDCHGIHNILDRLSDKSPIYKSNIPKLCAKCHAKGGRAAIRYKDDQPGDIVENYLNSTHGKGVIGSGLLSSAACTDCHEAHDILPSNDPMSSIYTTNIASTCAKCHKGIFDQFVTSVHSPTVTKTDKKLPDCSTCHSSHQIERVDQDNFLAQVGRQCGDCHKDVSETYFETYHGKAYKLGHLKAAKCSDCHGAHDILAPSNPASHLSRDNAVLTCKKCHMGSNKKFTGYLTHATHHNRYKYPILYFTFWGMVLLLVGTFVFFGIHTLLWLPKSFARLKEKKELRTQDEPNQFVRFNPRERLLHLTVIISFFGLAITGMMLKFANMTWAVWLAKIIGGPEAAGTIHRICAVITFGYFSAHVYTIIKYKKTHHLTWKELIFHKYSLVPSWTDLKEFAQTMLWFFDLGERPKYGRWTYWEKFDYFAVFWGVTIIGSTGLILWFPEIFTKFLPGWLINVATIVHSDEALLAVGFIFTIHFFNTHLRPDAFPMDPVIFTGRTPLSELMHDRPREYEELLAENEVEKRLASPVSKKRLKIIYVFGITCLVVGITLILLIIYSMIFGYK